LDLFVVLVVSLLSLLIKKLKVDDPVRAVSVHGVCGALGTLLVGVFATDGGLLYGGGFEQLGVQAIGVLALSLGNAASLSFVYLKENNGIE
jgi:Amt family ammonium transporter